MAVQAEDPPNRDKIFFGLQFMTFFSGCDGFFHSPFLFFLGPVFLEEFLTGACL